MKTPDDISNLLANQWHKAEIREQRLLDQKVWPVRIPISKPKPNEVTGDTASLKLALDRWRSVPTGRVIWRNISYRGLSDQLSVPASWEFADAAEWVRAINQNAITRDYEMLNRILISVSSAFHSFFIRQRQLVANNKAQELIQCAEVAGTLSPGCASGVPLRSLSIQGIDTKFFERNQATLTKLLDIRFDGQCSELGLEGFLAARPSGENWLLVVDLDGRLLPVEQMRVRASELRDRELPCKQLIVVENERCLHLLPQQPNTIAILGAGLDLSWFDADWIAKRSIAYWGDIDTWGLLILSAARQKQSHLTALMMTRDTFDQFRQASAVNEPNVAGHKRPQYLTSEEAKLYEYLYSQGLGRLEQEFLPKDFVLKQFRSWAS